MKGAAHSVLGQVQVPRYAYRLTASTSGSEYLLFHDYDGGIKPAIPFCLGICLTLMQIKFVRPSRQAFFRPQVNVMSGSENLAVHLYSRSGDVTVPFFIDIDERVIP